MANTWDTLDDNQRMALARHAMSGSRSNPENLNRAMDQLAANPKLVDRLMQEAGMSEADGELEDTQPDADMDQDNENDIERTVNEALSNEADVQETGELTQDIPPPERGEDMQSYIDRLLEMNDSEGGIDLMSRRRRVKINKGRTRMRPAGMETQIEE